MIEFFKESRARVHRVLELRLRSDYLNTAMGNPENVRQGVDRLLGYAGFNAGVPPPRCENVFVTEEGPVFTLGYVGHDPFFTITGYEDPLLAMNRLNLILKLLPSKVFGMEEMIRWVELTKFPPHRELSDKAAGALGDATGCEAFAKVLFRLMEERVPLKDTRTILEVVAAKARGTSVEALARLGEDIRAALRESSASYYLRYYASADVFRAGSALTSELGTAGEETAKNAICRVAKATTATFILVAEDGGARRKLWEMVENLFLSDRVNRPAAVLKADEIPSGVALPAAMEIPLPALRI